jgi:acylphosphatase
MTGSPDSVHAGQRLTLLVSGKVKRVRFRVFVRQQAEALGLAGWVRNRRRQVEILAEGSRPDLQQLYNAVLEGPPGAEVDTVEARWSEASGKLRSFRIRWIGFL